MLKFQKQYLVRVNYKSGIQEEFWCTEFNIKSRTYSWDPVGKNPLQLGADNVESVWVLNQRYRVVLWK